MMKMKRRRLTPIQRTVLKNMADHYARNILVFGPRGSIERLQKKGFVNGNRKDGWQISRAGLQWLAEERQEVGC